ncbi:MAG: LysR family transcriptional regulator, partial [Faecalispora jeddahensis]
MELRNVATFLRVAECESFTKAAEQLGYVQSTVTIQIQQLEAEICVPLFDRLGKHVSLTSSGQEFMVYA